MTKDEKDLKLLTTFHYITGALCAIFACFPLIHLSIGLAFIFAPESMHSPNQPPPPAFFGYIFAVIGGLMFLFGQVIAWSLIISGRFLNKRRHYMYSFCTACLACLFMPIGTILGIFSIIVLSRDSVKQLYNPDQTSTEGAIIY